MVKSLDRSRLSKTTHDERVREKANLLGRKSTCRRALARLYDEHIEALTRYLRAAFGSGPPDPDDIAQETFVKLAERGELESINNHKAFIWRTARNLMLSSRRKLTTRTKYDFEVQNLLFAAVGSHSSAERVLEVKEQLELINNTLAKMPENRRIAFLMHRIDGLNFSAIGRQMGMSPNGVIKHVGRAMLDIKNALDAASEHK